jgi:uncharacterized protein (TIGR00369 family)
MERNRTYSWHDPMVGAAAARSLAGIEYLQQMMDGKLPGPPIADTMDIRIESIESGKVVFTVVPQEFHYNPIGTVHGGVLATLADSAMGCAIHSALPAGVAYTTLELKVNYLRALTIQSGLVRCVGEVLYVGGRQATAEAKIFDGRNLLVSHATTTCLVMRP